MSATTLRVLATIALALVTGTAARADEHDYYVHFTATNMTPGWITVGSSDATPLVPPAGACGMVFESVYSASFILPYDIPGTPIPDGDVEIDLGNCGGGGVSIHNLDMPSGFEGAIKVLSARGYWVDGNQIKLIYKYSCAPNCSTKNNLYGGTAWHFVSELLGELKSSLAGKRQIRSLPVLLVMSDRYLKQLSNDLTTAVIARQRSLAGKLEPSVRRQEDDAQAKLISAIAQLRECQAFQGSGDLKSARLACDGALTAVSLGRTAIGTAGIWLSLE